MNRLILIGNGFDLAHGFKTNFKDFIDDYLCDCLNNFYKGKDYQDPLVKIYRENKTYIHTISDPVTPLNLEENLSYFKKLANLKFQINSELFETIYLKYEKLKWVDLEMEFFDQLIRWKKNESAWKHTVSKANSDLDYLKDRLLEYLSRNTRTLQYHEPLDKFKTLFTENINTNELSSTVEEKTISVDSLYFLNFNYTPTIEQYLHEIRSKKPFQHSYIHGSLSGNIKPVFGYGDEINKEYKEFEDQRNNELFKHIKSFHYSLNEEYFNLIRFIDSQEYQVSIFGHSCGLSDRTMLNQIFEHPNCKSIKIFFHKISPTENDFLEKIYDIYRHFGNKGEARKKIVPFKMSSPMPQNPIIL
ncbi:AbiH family protein [Algoriphagus terrigena]|uniref:AbiH family protein n=1 Tax=Algoriphagus terrigena TaxID=344884 RepID=UPI00040AE5A2|nr:AbiH family protein [Algoriphagus terrigena]